MNRVSIAWTSAFVAGAVLALACDVNAQSVAPQSTKASPKPKFTPADRPIPDDEFGKIVAEGQRIFDDPSTYAKAYVGNALRCASCHLDQGRKADSAPMWAAWLSYPAYRTKDHEVNTFAERLRGCFRYSMNGKPPPLGDPVLVALESYSYWLAQGAPLDPDIAGRGYTKVAKPAQAPDYHRGEAVYQARCALCHAADGGGQRARNGAPAFPALWGDASFNWGAGMANINNAAGFIKGNMPLGQGGTLTDQEAWDVAMFIDSHDRPQDPRFTESVEATRKQFHDTAQSMYGRSVNGTVLGSRSTPSGGTLRAGDKP